MSHRREHAVGSTSDHTDTGYTQGNLVAYDANGLPAADGGDPATIITMQAAYDNDEAITFSKDMTWDLNEAYDFKIEEGADHVYFEAAAAHTLDVDMEIRTMDVRASSVISLDAVVSSNFTVTGDSVADRTLILAVTNAGDGDAKLDLSADDEIELTSALVDVNTTVYALDSTSVSIDALTSSNFTMTADSSSDRFLTIQAINNGGGRGDIVLSADDIIDVNAVNFDLDSTVIALDSTYTSHFTMTANDSSDHTLTISATNAGDGDAIIAINATDVIDVDTKLWDVDVDSADIDASAVDIDATAQISLDSASDSNFTMTANSTGDRTLTLAVSNTDTGAAILKLDASVDSNDKVWIIGETVDVDAAAYELDATTVSIDSTSDSNLSLTANDAGSHTLTIAASNAGAGRADIDMDADSVFIDAAEAISLDSTRNSNFTITADAIADRILTIQTSNSGTGSSEIRLISDKDIVVTPAGALDVDAANVAIDATATFSIQGAESSDITLAASNASTQVLTISASNGAIGYGNIDIDADYIEIDAAYEISIDSTRNSNFTMSANSTSDHTLTLSVTNANTGAAILKLDASADSNDKVWMIGETVDIDAVACEVDATTVSIDSTTDSNVTVTGNSSDDETLTISATNSGTGKGVLALASDNELTVNTGDMDVNVSSITVDATSAFSIDAVANSNVTVTGDSGTTATLTLQADNSYGLGFAYVDIKAKTQVRLYRDSDVRLTVQSGAVVVNDPGDQVDFRVESLNKTHLLYTYGLNDIVAVDADSLTVIKAADAAFNVSNHTWLLGDQIYDIDFSGSTADTPAEMLDLGIYMSAESGHPTFLGDYGFDSGNNVTTSHWQYITSTGWAVDGWSTQRQVSVMSWPLNRGDNWQILVDFDVAAPPSNNDEETLHIGVMGLGGYVSFYARCRMFKDAFLNQYYNAELWTNDGDASFSKEYDGTALTSTGSYQLGLRCWNGVIAVYDDQDDSWHEYTGRFGESATADWATFGILHAFIALGESNDAEAAEVVTITNLNFKYLK